MRGKEEERQPLLESVELTEVFENQDGFPLMNLPIELQRKEILSRLGPEDLGKMRLISSYFKNIIDEEFIGKDDKVLLRVAEHCEGFEPKKYSFSSQGTIFDLVRLSQKISHQKEKMPLLAILKVAAGSLFCLILVSALVFGIEAFVVDQINFHRWMKSREYGICRLDHVDQCFNSDSYNQCKDYCGDKPTDQIYKDGPLYLWTGVISSILVGITCLSILICFGKAAFSEYKAHKTENRYNSLFKELQQGSKEEKNQANEEEDDFSSMERIV